MRKVWLALMGSAERAYSFYLRELSTICIKPLRIAFDHLGLKKPYEQAVRYAHEFGLYELSNYMLYNFHDSPDDLYERMRLNLDLNEELGIRIYSFPMRYQPTDLPDRSFVGEKWTRYQLRSMQMILQATHGVVSGEPGFFRRAFGNSHEEFEAILSRPHHQIFNREWYEKLGGRSEFDDYMACSSGLSASERRELLSLLSSTHPRNIASLAKLTSSANIKKILKFYVPLSKNKEARIWARPRIKGINAPKGLPEDQHVEDAGLTEDEVDMVSIPSQNEKRNDRQLELL